MLCVHTGSTSGTLKAGSAHFFSGNAKKPSRSTFHHWSARSFFVSKSAICSPVGSQWRGGLPVPIGGLPLMLSLRHQSSPNSCQVDCQAFLAWSTILSGRQMYSHPRYSNLSASQSSTGNLLDRADFTTSAKPGSVNNMRSSTWVRTSPRVLSLWSISVNTQGSMWFCTTRMRLCS